MSPWPCNVSQTLVPRIWLKHSEPRFQNFSFQGKVWEKVFQTEGGGDYWLTGPIKYCEWNRCEFIFNVTIHTAKTLVFLFKYFKASKMYIVRGERGIGNNLRVYFEWIFVLFRDTLDVVKQSAALCLLRLFRTDPSVIPSGRFLVFKDGHRKKWRIGRMDI